MKELIEMCPRAEELANRLTMAGQKAEHVSASETHELADFVHACVGAIRAPAAAWRSDVENAGPKNKGYVLLVDGNGHKVLAHWQPGGHCIEDHPPIDRGWYYWNGREFDVFRNPTAWMPVSEEA